MSAANDETAKDEMKNLEGTWQLLSAMKDGKETPAEVVKKIRVAIRGGKHTVYFGDEVAAKEIPFAVDPTKSPKTTVDTLPGGKEIKGIYKLEGDMLTSCVAETGKDRPSEFDSKPGSGHTLRVFKRVHL
ncbi:MAG: TIGR03067 domain-containing protein [Chloroflexota bacterium]